MANVNELAKILSHELGQGCKNTSVIGGIEKFIANWAQRTRTADNSAVIDQIVAATSAYGSADSAQRKTMIQHAVMLSRQLAAAPPPTPQPRPTPPPPRPQQPPAPSRPPAARVPLPDEDNDEDNDEPLPSAPPQRMDFGLDDSVERMQGVGRAKKSQLERLGIATVRDLLYYFPRAYRPVKNVSELMYGDEATIVAQVSHISEYKTRNGFHITDVVFMDSTGGITAKFFNQPWLARSLHPRQYIVVSGKIDRDLNKLSFRSPETEPLTKELQRLLEVAHVYPVYPLTQGVKANWLRKTERSVVAYWADKVPDPLPPHVRQPANLMPLPRALREIHFPSSIQAMAEARRRFGFEELLYIQLGVLQRRHKWQSEPGKAFTLPEDFMARYEGGLPFALTEAQKRAIGQILGDIQRTAPMSRLLQGDVGSGKTVVAAAALLVAVQNGMQSVLMAPTEILAEQHYKTLGKIMPALADEFGIPLRVGVLMGSLKQKEKEAAQRALAAGEIDVAVGTHALIQESVNFDRLALAVVDEQHRFGVEQRGALRQKGYYPHILVMSATPIPRSLALTVYGDLDLSILDELPPGRTPITTKWLEPNQRERAYRFIRKHVTEGRQAFVICPLIEESENIDAKAAVEEYEHLSTEIFPDLRVGLIHGKLRPSEKDAVMNDFRDHKLDILVATSVVEVGIDVPNATVMLIEGADRFGLAQLHQFRGRVGRGAHESFCMLLAEKSGSVSDDRLKIIEATQDGFKLAEADLVMRGPGEFFGTRQSGVPDLRVAKLTDVTLLEEARRSAEQVFAKDPELIQPEHQLLREGMQRFWHGAGDQS